MTEGIRLQSCSMEADLEVQILAWIGEEETFGVGLGKGTTTASNK